jgi:hypothetical protein
MAKHRLVVAAVLLVGWSFAGSAWTTAGKDEPAPQKWKILATASGGPPLEVDIPFEMGVYRTSAELAGAVLPKTKKKVDAVPWAVKALKVKQIDWENQMLLCLDGGGFRGTYYVVNPTSLTSDGKVLTVRYEVIRKIQKNGVADASFSNSPRILLLVERFAGEVKFVKAPDYRDDRAK